MHEGGGSRVGSNKLVELKKKKKRKNLYPWQDFWLGLWKVLPLDMVRNTGGRAVGGRCWMEDEFSLLKDELSVVYKVEMS